ncbi:MAG TPA: hypothetical protein VFE79_20740 [Paraburkholderia sp.]|jgi:hypothetical protein|nr:hypothetical protein [Paraburkholderia sp.]
MRSGRHIVGKDGKAVPVEFDPNNPETHAAAHGYEDALAAGAAFNKLTPKEIAERTVKRDAPAKAPQPASAKTEGAKS